MVAILNTLTGGILVILGILIQIISSNTTEGKKRKWAVWDESINKFQDAIVIQFNLFWEMLNLSTEIVKENPDTNKIDKLLNEYLSKVTYPNINELKLLSAYGTSLHDDDLDKLIKEVGTVKSNIDKVVEACIAEIDSPDRENEGALIVITALNQDLQSLLSRIYECLRNLRTK